QTVHFVGLPWSAYRRRWKACFPAVSAFQFALASPAWSRGAAVLVARPWRFIRFQMTFWEMPLASAISFCLARRIKLRHALDHLRVIGFRFSSARHFSFQYH